MRQLLDHLVRLGRRRIGIIIGQSNPAACTDDRMRGYLSGVAEHNLDQDAGIDLQRNARSGNGGRRRSDATGPKA